MGAPSLRLYHYWRSSSSWRVRWAFALKGIACEYVPVDLLNGEVESPAHLARNPLGYVPVLEFVGAPEQRRYLFESLAIIGWADENFGGPALLPSDPYMRGCARQLAELINADTQPLQNLNAQFIHSDDPVKRKAWALHWIQNGLQAYETIARQSAGKFSVGDSVTIADLCLLPQIYNARRNDVGLDNYPTIARICAEAEKTEAYQVSAPDRFQPPAKA